MSALAPIQDIIADIKAGKMVILVDEEDRENEGDLVLAADFVTPEAINFMARFGRGLICLTLTEERCKQLGLKLMVQDNRSPYETAFTTSIEAARGVTTGISAHDRAQTVRAAVARNAKPEDIVQPGHIFPLMARKGGVLIRAGHTEAGCDLAQLAGFEPAAVICEILNEDGSMARLPDLIEFAKKHGLKIGAIRDLIQYRLRTETLVRKAAERAVSTAYGDFTLYAFEDETTGEVHFAAAHGEIEANRETLVRVHEPISVLDFLAPEAPGHSVPVPEALRRIASSPAGVMVMLHRPQSGQELLEVLTQTPARRRAWDPRLLGVGAQILHALGVGKMRLLSHPMSFPNLSGFGLEITGFEDPPAAKG